MLGIRQLLIIQILLLVGARLRATNRIVKQMGCPGLFIQVVTARISLQIWRWGIIVPVCFAWSDSARLQQRKSTLVETVKGLFAIERFTERLECAELANRVLIQLLHTVEGLLAYSLLIISQKKTSEIWSLEKVFALVLRFRHAKDVLVCRVHVFWTLLEFAPNFSRGYATLRSCSLRFSLLGFCGLMPRLWSMLVSLPAWLC